VHAKQDEQMPPDNLQLRRYDYYLPTCDIAQQPAAHRSLSRLLVLDCSCPPGSPTGIHHATFSDITGYLRPGDCLVLNETRVIPARLRGFKVPTGGLVEVFVTEIESGGYCRALLRPARRLRADSQVAVVTPKQFDRLQSLSAEKRAGHLGEHLPVKVTQRLDGGEFRVLMEEGSPLRNLHRFGSVPLPPYISADLDDRRRYQTVYANDPGSVAAPTAGLHFTESLLADIRDCGVRTVTLTLHVGEGTFQPVRCEDITRHHMHSEYCEVSPEVVDAVGETRSEGGKVVAVGTTVVRALEAASREGRLRQFCGATDLFIYPGYRFRTVDALITNFHLPRSTLLMLVSALTSREHILAAYREARRRRYRFYSFGDAMLLLPEVR